MHKKSKCIQTYCKKTLLKCDKVFRVYAMSYTAENKSYNLFICDDCDHNILTSRSFTQHQRTYQTRKNTRADSKNAKKILNLKASSQN